MLESSDCDLYEDIDSLLLPRPDEETDVTVELSPRDIDTLPDLVNLVNH